MVRQVASKPAEYDFRMAHYAPGSGQGKHGRALFPLVFSAALSTSPMGKPFMRTPDIHGDSIVFSCEGDLWLGNMKDGPAERMTSDSGLEDNASFSPDGT